MINKDFAVMKVILMFHQELSIRFRKRFERCKRDKDDSKLLPSIIETIEVAGMIRVVRAIRIVEAIERSELRRVMIRTQEHRNESIRNELITR